MMMATEPPSKGTTKPTPDPLKAIKEAEKEAIRDEL